LKPTTSYLPSGGKVEIPRGIIAHHEGNNNSHCPRLPRLTDLIFLLSSSRAWPRHWQRRPRHFPSKCRLSYCRIWQGALVFRLFSSHWTNYYHPALAVDMTARNLQEEVKKKGLPWSAVKGFDTFTPIRSFFFFLTWHYIVSQIDSLPIPS
jgi:acylpyruvate hydrolase